MYPLAAEIPAGAATAGELCLILYPICRGISTAWRWNIDYFRVLLFQKTRRPLVFRPGHPYNGDKIGRAARYARRFFMAQIFINGNRSAGTINKNIYGQFAEHLGRCIYGG